MAKYDVELSEAQKELLAAVQENNTDAVKTLLPNANFNFYDEHGMTPLQYACYKGNKDIVQIMLDMGADINLSKHGSQYTPLHFAALSGNAAVCRALLDAGIDPNLVNSVNRTAAQMAAFVGNHACVETINSYVNRDILEPYTISQGEQTEPLIGAAQLDGFHEFVISVNLHPVRVVMNLQTLGLHKNLSNVKRTLELMCEKEMKKAQNANELLALKLHYFSWIVKELMRVQQQRKETASTTTAAGSSATAEGDKDKNQDYFELFIKRILKENKQGQLDYLEYVIREAVREFPFWECTIFRQIAQALASKEPLPALSVWRNAINGNRGFTDESGYCSTCGNEKPDKKCSKCKAVQYCDRECQRLHWFMHKKSCARPISTTTTTTATATTSKPSIDADEIRAEFTKLTT